MNLAAGAEVDRYDVLSKLGQGGMAVVYKVRHRQLGTLHALKVLTISTPSVRKRLLLEGRAQATLRHPNIVPVTDVIDVNGQPGLVMEYVDGPSLGALLRRHHLTVAQADELVQGILAGVARAHEHHLVHRDLKPDNILCAIHKGVMTPKVADFGLVKALTADASETETRSGVTMGTPHYMAPEQIRNSKHVDHRADVWSLGVILYEMTCGVRPFHDEDMLGLFQKIAEGRYVRSPGLPDRMSQAIEAALQVDVTARIPDCEALLAVWTGRPRGTEEPTWSRSLLEGLSPEDDAAVGAPPTIDPGSMPPSAPGSDTWGGVTGGSIDSAGILSPSTSPPAARRGSWALTLGVGGLGLAGVGSAVLVALVVGVGAGIGAVPSSDGEGSPSRAESLPTLTTPSVAPAAGPAASEALGTPAIVAPVEPLPEPAPARRRSQPPLVSEPAGDAVVASEPAAPPTEPAPAAMAPPTGVAEPKITAWQLAGDAQRAFLVSEDGVFPPGPVSPGTYHVQLVGTEGPILVGEVTLADGESRTLTCSARAGRCR